MLDTLPTLSASGTATGTYQLADWRGVNFTLMVRLETPGECCVAISSAVAFAYEPPLPDDIAVRLDDRIYDGLYDGLAAIEGPLPPEHLKVAVETLTSEPPLATVLEPVNWPVITGIGDRLAALAAEAVVAAWPELARRTMARSVAMPALP
jgi:hypothetical protein